MPQDAFLVRHPVRPLVPLNRWIGPVIHEMHTWPAFEPAPVGNHLHSTSISALYRFYGDNQLLYVGVTTNPAQRWRTHTNTDWWHLTRFVSIEPVPPRDRLQREWDAIQAERPRFNGTRSWRRPNSKTERPRET